MRSQCEASNKLDTTHKVHSLRVKMCLGEEGDKEHALELTTVQKLIQKLKPVNSKFYWHNLTDVRHNP
jgi:hypothetical protein